MFVLSPIIVMAAASREPTAMKAASNTDHDFVHPTLTPPPSEKKHLMDDAAAASSSDLSDLEDDDDSGEIEPDHYYEGGRIPVFKPVSSTRHLPSWHCPSSGLKQYRFR